MSADGNMDIPATVLRQSDSRPVFQGVWGDRFASTQHRGGSVESARRVSEISVLEKMCRWSCVRGRLCTFALVWGNERGK